MKTWILEPDVFKNELTDLIDSLNKYSIKYQTHKFGFPYESYTKLEGNNYVFHGSYQLAKYLKNSVQWNGLFCNFQKYECLYYYPRFGESLLNQWDGYIMLPFGVIANRDYAKELFIKPSKFKIFPGTVLNHSNRKQKLLEFSLKADPEELVVISPAWNIKREWRAVVYKKKIIAISQYNDSGITVRLEGAPQEVIDYGNTVLESIKYFNPDPIWILDLCETDFRPNKSSESRLAVLEVGPFACCGLYACNKDPIIEAINEILE